MDTAVVIVLLFYRGSGFIDAAIRWQTRSRFSHVACEFPDGTVYESLPRKGVHAHRGAYPGVTKRLYITLTADEAAALRRAFDRKVGHRYDYRGVVRFVSRRRASETDNREFCSDLIALCFKEIGKPLQRAESWKLAPEHLAWSPLLREKP